VVFKDTQSRQSNTYSKNLFVRFSINDLPRVVERHYHLSEKVLQAAEKDAKFERSKFEDIQVKY
jgi:hypothetical protein